MAAPSEDLAGAIAQASNAALAKGALAAGITASMATGAVTVLSLSSPWLVMPAFTVGSIAVWCFGVHALAKRSLVVGTRAWAVLLSLHLIPVASGLIGTRVVAFGPATFPFGPIGFVFLVAVVLSGLSFEPALARVSGVVGGLGLLVFHTLSRPNLLTLESATKELSASIVLSATAAERLTGDRRTKLSPLGEVKLKGKAQPVPVEGLRVS
jgi:hypothetical protein